ncbi:MAG: hypothetical protein GXO23_02700 [Crenarchaeota archaeon]|nr:hypothetical protein [Thermoproteota archaeon]
MKIERKIIEKIAEEIALSLGKSEKWKERIIRRVIEGTIIRIIPERLWIVKGLPHLGDRYPSYEIYRKDKRYICTCYTHPWSSRRRPCTHVGAVLLYENMIKILNMEPGPGFEPGK